MATDPTTDPRLTAALDMIGRTGAREFQLRWSDDEQPVVWFAVGAWTGENGTTAHECAAALHPVTAVLRLLDQTIDGASCTHCQRPTGIVSDLVPTDMPFDQHICWYQFDPELVTYRRGCEGT